jgi:hypothetical protein
MPVIGNRPIAARGSARELLLSDPRDPGSDRQAANSRGPSGTSVLRPGSAPGASPAPGEPEGAGAAFGGRLQAGLPVDQGGDLLAGQGQASLPRDLPLSRTRERELLCAGAGDRLERVHRRGIPSCRGARSAEHLHLARRRHEAIARLEVAALGRESEAKRPKSAALKRVTTVPVLVPVAPIVNLAPYEPSLEEGVPRQGRDYQDIRI